MNKKGAIGVLTWLILFLVVAVIMLIFYSNIYEATNAVTAREKCRISAEAKHNAFSSALTKRFPLECYTELTEIKPDGVYVTNLNTGKTDKITSVVEIERKLQREGKLSDKGNDEKKRLISEELIQRGIADQLYSCWDQFGQGKLVPFERPNPPSFSEVTCIICSEISFDPALKESANIDNYHDWLRVTNVPSRDSTYAELFGSQFRTILSSFSPSIPEKLYVVYWAEVQAIGRQIIHDDTTVLGFYYQNQIDDLGCQRLY